MVVSYGGGVNSVAVLVLLAELGLATRVAAIVMADPGHERSPTKRYLEEVTRPFCAAHGLPDPVVITRAEEGKRRERAWRLETLGEECERIGSLPSVAYGWKKCSQKYKGEPQRWWCARQDWCLDEWAADRRVVRVMGYDVDESRRVAKGQSFFNEWEAKRFVSWYPLHEAGIDREGCEDVIARAGLPPAVKSACTFCPNNTLAEWEALRREEPEAFAYAVAMSRRAEPGLDSPDVVGLMRCNPMGKRQLHVWADGGYGGELGPETENPLPCECAT